MATIIFTGRPGSGKGTQAQLLADRLDIPHISTGDIFREEVKQKTPLGLQITESMKAGRYTSDEITNEVIRKRLGQPDTAKGFILDGYPRTLNQVEFLDSLDVTFDAVFDLHLDEEAAVNRLLLRASEQSREDDNEHTIRDRMKIYADTVGPVLDAYYRKGILEYFSAVGKISDIHDKLYSTAKIFG